MTKTRKNNMEASWITLWLPRVYLLCVCFRACLSFDVYNVEDRFGVERRFDGIGGLSGGGATSKLLVNYPQEQRDQILDFLFKPNFGASLHMLKVEIGGDAQSTDGTEASHMHYSWDENYERGYEWWLMVEAKKRNPDILLYCLPWAFPAWVGDGTRNPYHNPKLTSSYIIKFIQGAQTHYNLTFDYVGIWNERHYSSEYIETLRSMLDQADLQHVKIVASDSTWEPISLEIIASGALNKSVDIIGTHYPGTKSSTVAMNTGKQLWASEDYSTFNDNVGAGCWARILNQNYVNGYMTSTISWNLIASYYEALPYTRNGLMTADNPWSGYYRVDGPIWISAHTTQFTKPGWFYLKHDSGVSLLKNGGSLVTLVSPEKSDFTVVIETMSHNHSICIRPFLPPYNVSSQSITLRFNGSFANVSKVYVWHTRLGFDGTNSSLFKALGSFPVVNGELNVQLEVDEVYTITTLNVGNKGDYPAPPESKSFPLPYADDFESYREHAEPYNLAQQTGAYEVMSTSTSHKNILRQMVTSHPVAWCQAENVSASINLVGDYNWSDIYVEVDAQVGPVNGTKGVFVAARVDKGGCNSFGTRGIFFFIYPANQSYQVTGDLARSQLLKEGNSPDILTGWNNLALLVKGGYTVGYLNGKMLFNITTPGKPYQQNGFVALGTSSYGLADYDNLKIHSSDEGYRLVKERKLKQDKENLREKVTVFSMKEEIDITVDEILRFVPSRKKFKPTV